MTITCDTPISSIISVEDVEPIISSVGEEVDNYSSIIKEVIQAEESSGGLSSQAYYVDDVPELNNQANNFLSSFKINSSFETCKAEIIASVNAQRKKELGLLKNEVSKKIIELRDQINSLKYNSDGGPTKEIDSLLVLEKQYEKKYIEIEGMI